ncbi:succinate dehydrogenase assembly factor 2, mitochondrial-like [Rhodnius prolixus]|uniref:Succinate dehydrogenase assembly factor 2, mitochondrial n=2 Tax=Rhodnius TaxID=13248 RepID=T1HCE0_RHOPR
MTLLKIWSRNVCTGIKLFNNFVPSSEYDMLPKYRVEEPVDIKRARLLYQSRKRGILENCLLLGTFAADHLSQLDPKLLHQYDEIINLPTEWELYYWVMGTRTVPQRFDNDIMALLKLHVKKNEKRLRSSQPDVVEP